MEKELTLKMAKKFGIIKWKHLAKTGAERITDPKIKMLLDPFPGHCGFCEYQNKHPNNNFAHFCGGCVLADLVQEGRAYLGCCGSLYGDWTFAKTIEERKLYAKKILKRIKAVKV